MGLSWEAVFGMSLVRTVDLAEPDDGMKSVDQVSICLGDGGADTDTGGGTEASFSVEESGGPRQAQAP
jgi:hypothetical protein